MTEVVEYEPGQEVAVYEQKLIGASSPQEFVTKAADIAVALATVVEDRKLFTVISGRKHVRVEGWTFLGSMMGAFGNPVYAICEWSRPIEEDGQIIGWEARVVAKTLDGLEVGASEAMCTRKERTWKTRDDYALRSMAQTRATSKALRQPLGFLMELAGYAATPQEEMVVEDHTPPAPPAPASAEGIAELSSVLREAQKIDVKLWSVESVLASASREFSHKIEKLAELTTEEALYIKSGAEAWMAAQKIPAPETPFDE